MEPYLGEIKMFAGNFAPQGWALCNGQLMSISQYSALFSILGTVYGGNGIATFGLPNLMGRAPIHWGAGPGLTNRIIGESAGVENVSLTISQIPAHTHLLTGSTAPATQGSPAGNILATATDDASGGIPLNFVAPTAGSLVSMSPTALSVSGGNLPHQNMQPYLAVTFIIALQGVFPSRG